MTTKSEGQHTGEFLVSEAPGTLSRDAITVTAPAATLLEAGAVLGQIAASGKYVAYDEAWSDGRETAAGILYDNVDNTDGVAEADFDVTVVNFNAEVRSDDLVWGTGVDETGGLADLRALGIKARS